MTDHLALQREFFEILDDFFKNATGERPEDFADLDKFGEAIHQKGRQLAPRAAKAFGKVVEDLKRFYVWRRQADNFSAGARGRRDEVGTRRDQSLYKLSLGLRRKDGSVR